MPVCPECMIGFHNWPYQRWRKFKLLNGKRCSNDWHNT